MAPDNLKQQKSPWERFWQKYPKEYKALEELETRLGYRFKTRTLLFEALTHRSAVNVKSTDIAGLVWNERIEFLGDAVLGLVISTVLWHKQEHFDEGALSRIRSSLVNASQLADIAKKLDLAKVVVLGKGEEKAGGRKRESLLADALEAVIGAVYLDGGFAEAEAVVRHLFDSCLAGPFEVGSGDFKTQLQEWSQENFQIAPEYHLLSEVGPDHAKEFEVGVLIEGRVLATGRGASKKRASQEAAKTAMSQLGSKHD